LRRDFKASSDAAGRLVFVISESSIVL